MGDEDITLKITDYNLFVLDQLFRPKPILPVGDGTCSDQEEAEPDLEWRGGKFV